ncbi:MAG: DUF3618 domain-containing protein [Alphaproteobacteria bacterium]|nr:DUF3618 domain-containing protein [Alphaproteobacteria bacterium]
MTNESPEQIEREIEHDRNELRRTLDNLQDELSLDGLSRRLTGTFREHGSEWANSASEAARSNPVALALTGIGLAWLIFGRGYDPAHSVRDAVANRRHNRHDHDDDRSWNRGSMNSRPGSTGIGTGTGTGTVSSGTTGTTTSYAGSTGSSGGMGSSGSTGSSGSSSWRDYAERYAPSRLMGGGSHGDHQGMTDRIRDQAQHLRDRLSDGTEGLSEEARRRVEDARRRAMDASEATSRRLRQGSRSVMRGYDTEPLLFGVAALALGAGLGAALPRTAREDELMGSYSDHLFDEAESIYQEEMAKVKSAVSAGVDQAKSAASDVAKAAQDELKSSGGDDQERADKGTSSSSSSSSTGGSGRSV